MLGDVLVVLKIYKATPYTRLLGYWEGSAGRTGIDKLDKYAYTHTGIQGGNVL